MNVIRKRLQHFDARTQRLGLDNAEVRMIMELYAREKIGFEYANDRISEAQFDAMRIKREVDMLRYAINPQQYTAEECQPSVTVTAKNLK